MFLEVPCAARDPYRLEKSLGKPSISSSVYKVERSPQKPRDSRCKNPEFKNRHSVEGIGIPRCARDFRKTALRQVQRPLERSALFLNFFLQQRDGMDQLLRPRRAAGHVNINRDDLVHAL